MTTEGENYVPSDQVLRESEEILSPEATSGEIDSAVALWRAGIRPEPLSPQERLRQLQYVERGLDLVLAHECEVDEP